MLKDLLFHRIFSDISSFYLKVLVDETISKYNCTRL